MNFALLKDIYITDHDITSSNITDHDITSSNITGHDITSSYYHKINVGLVFG